MSNETSNKICIIGIDGGSFNLLDPLIKQGKLPNISQLIQEGVHGTLKSTIPPITAPAWSSFMTGKTPDNHGILNFLSISDVSNYNYKLNNRTCLKSKTIWRLLSEQGKRVICINTPMTFPPERINGIMVSGMLAERANKRYYYPPEIDAILQKYDYIIEPYELDTKIYGLPEAIFETMKRRIEVAKTFMQQYSWDVFMVTFTGSDRLQHTNWGDKIIDRYYEQLDTYLGQLFELVPGETIKMIISDHGFDKAQYNVAINEILERRDLLNFHILSGEDKSDRYFCLSDFARIGNILHKEKRNDDTFNILEIIYRSLGINRKLKNYIPTDIQQYLRNFLPPFLYKSLPKEKIYIDLEETTIFYPFKSSFAFTRGLCNQNMQDDRLQTHLRDIFKQISFEGEPIIKDIIPGAILYPRHFNSQALDFVIIPKHWPSWPPTCLPSREMVSDVSKLSHGGHTRNGIFIASAKGLKKGKANLTLEDLAPTILYLAGCEIPKDLDGQVQRELFESVAEDPKFGPPSSLDPSNDVDVPTGAAEEEVMRRLQDLGYL